MDSIIYTRIKELCTEKGITISKLECEIGMSQYSIGKWKNTTTPTIDKISRIAKYFSVSIDFLVGATDIRSSADELIKDRDFVSLQRARERLSERDKNRMMAMLKIGFDYAFSDGNENSDNESGLMDI